MTPGPNEHIVSIEEIIKILPHRFPFLLVDRVLETVPQKRIVAIKNVTINEPFFPGHFPGAPVMPRREPRGQPEAFEVAASWEGEDGRPVRRGKQRQGPDLI